MLGKQCFIIMPFSSTSEAHSEKYWNHFYEILKKIIEPLGFSCTRSQVGPYNMISQIVKHINESDLAIAVITDLNPNVWYELGIRHSLKNGTIMLLEKGQKIPFDISAYGVIFYDDGIALSITLEKEIQEYVAKIDDRTSDSPVLAALNSVPRIGIVEIDEKLKDMRDFLLKWSKEFPVKDMTDMVKPWYNRILWVDDYPSNNEIIIDLFENRGIRFDLAVTTAQGINLFKENKYDIIITDMGRGKEPDAGLKLIEKLKKLDCDTPIIVFASKNAIDIYGDDAYMFGAIDVVYGAGSIISLISKIFDDKKRGLF